MGVSVFVDGEIFTPEQAKISIFDRGFLYGDSIYEVLRTSGGAPVDLVPHLDRLERGTRRLGFAPTPRDVIVAATRSAIAQALSDKRSVDAYVRIVVTRGGGPLDLDPAAADRPRLIVLAKDLLLPPATIIQNGADIRIVDVPGTVRGPDPMVKSGNYLPNVLALGEAKRQGAYEAFLRDSTGRIVEGASSNVFCVLDSTVVTPPLCDGLLDGITRRRILLLADAAGVGVREESLWSGTFARADEAFLSSSIRGVVPVRRVDGMPVGGAHGQAAAGPGPVTQLLMSAYDEFLLQSARGTWDV